LQEIASFLVPTRRILAKLAKREPRFLCENNYFTKIIFAQNIGRPLRRDWALETELSSLFKKTFRVCKKNKLDFA